MIYFIVYCVGVICATFYLGYISSQKKMIYDGEELFGMVVSVTFWPVIVAGGLIFVIPYMIYKLGEYTGRKLNK